MNEKIINWFSVLAILVISGGLYRADQITRQHLVLIIFIPLIVGIIYRQYAWKYARSVVIKRRRLLKELWRRDLTQPQPLEKYEEELVVLLGRIKMAVPFTIGMVVIIVVIVFFGKNIFGSNIALEKASIRILAPSLALGSIFLAARLHWISNSIAHKTAPDSQDPAREHEAYTDYPPTVCVEIDRYKVHDFILPNAALPFWTMKDAERWLEKCGFEREGILKQAMTLRGCVFDEHVFAKLKIPMP